jgi:hypothetical protein
VCINKIKSICDLPSYCYTVNEKVPYYKQTWKKKEDEGKERSSLVEIFLPFIDVDANF